MVSVYEVQHDSAHDRGIDPGLIKDGAESHLQKLLAEHIHLLGEGFTFVRGEYMTAIGPVDILAQDAAGRSVAVELKRNGDIDGVEQLPRTDEPRPAPRAGQRVFSGQTIKPQARKLAEDRGIVEIVGSVVRFQADAALRLNLDALAQSRRAFQNLAEHLLRLPEAVEVGVIEHAHTDRARGLDRRGGLVDRGGGDRPGGPVAARPESAKPWES